GAVEAAGEWGRPAAFCKASRNVPAVLVKVVSPFARRGSRKLPCRAAEVATPVHRYFLRRGPNRVVGGQHGVLLPTAQKPAIKCDVPEENVAIVTTCTETRDHVT